MKNSPQIETKRFILRKFCDQDIDDLHDILKDEIVNTYLPWFISKDKEDTKKFLFERIYTEYQKEVSYFYAIEFKKTHRVIGYIDVTDIDIEEKCGDLGYGIHRDYWKQGIASETAQALIHQLKSDGFHFVYATCDQKNIASGKVMQKCGMTYQYSYEENWQPKNKTVIFRLYQLNLDEQKERVFMKYWNMYSHH
ncbi:MAG: GNAT family N-acetyltransferase, partial [Faecalibacillus sp.]